MVFLNVSSKKNSLNKHSIPPFEYVQCTPNMYCDHPSNKRNFVKKEENVKLPYPAFLLYMVT